MGVLSLGCLDMPVLGHLLKYTCLWDQSGERDCDKELS